MNSFKKNIYKQTNSFCVLPILNAVMYTNSNLVSFDFDTNGFQYGTPNGNEMQYSIDGGITWLQVLNQIVITVGLHGGEITQVPSGTSILYKIVLSGNGCNNQNSNIINGGNWQGNNLINLAPQCIVPAQYSNPNTANGNNICSTGNQWTTSNIGIDTLTPQIGTKLYVYNTGLLALPGNMSSFDNVLGSTFNIDGIKWIRFSSYSNDIFDVNPTTGMITGISSTFICP